MPLPLMAWIVGPFSFLFILGHQAVRGLAGKRSAVMLANHGPVVAGADVEAACNAIEELEDSARLAMMTRGLSPRMLSAAQVTALVDRFDVEWDA